ncbi:MAG: hypothetical protein QQN40_07485 [Nitrosopumilus sp.]
MNKTIKKFDGKGVYYKKYDDDVEIWYKCDRKNKCIYYKFSDEDEYWYKYDEVGNRIVIKEKKEINKIKDIEFRRKEKEYNSRTKCSRFELMEI